MDNIQRRDFLIGTAAFAAGVTAVLTGTQQAEAGDPSFMNNVPDPLFSQEDLPNFKYALEKSKAKVMGKNTAREVTVAEFPISKGIAGVSMELAPGVMRELHWHATAAEWAFVNKGRVRTTVLGPGGVSETNDFETGDIWYFPRGYGHMLECLGTNPATSF
jgi:oxalate decarboxylase